jgi:hypothetical protein
MFLVLYNYPNEQYALISETPQATLMTTCSGFRETRRPTYRMPIKANTNRASASTSRQLSDLKVSVVTSTTTGGPEDMNDLKDLERV